MKKKSTENSKKPYRKPELRAIELTADEVLGAGCKTTTSADPGFDPCIVGCFADGS